MDGENSPERKILLGRTAEYYYAGASKPLTTEEIDRISNPQYFADEQTDKDNLPITHEREIHYPDGQLELVYPVYAFDGLQSFVRNMEKVAECIGGCVVDEEVRRVMDSRYSLVEHVQGAVPYSFIPK